MENSIYSLLPPPLIAILMVILTRKVLLSLGIGIVTAALLLGRRQYFKYIINIMGSAKSYFLGRWSIKYMEYFYRIICYYPWCYNCFYYNNWWCTRFW